MKADILTMGELNVDLILSQLQSFPKLGTEVLADRMVLALGSSSAIFASNSAALGASVSFLGKVGTDYFGKFIIEALKANNVKTAPIIRSADYQTGATIAFSFAEDRAMVTHPGAMNYLGGESLTSVLLGAHRHLHVSSVFLQPLVKRDIVDIFRRAKAAGLSTSLDLQWDPYEKWDLDFPELLKHVDIFLPNESELKGISGGLPLEAAIDRFAPQVKYLVVKLGTEGSIAVANGRRVVAPPYLNRETVDAIGAGDSFDAGFVTKFLTGAGLESCLRYGNLMGAINTTAAGGTAAFSSRERLRETAMNKFGVDPLTL